MENKKKAMICQPMNGLTEEEIKAVRENATEFLNANGYKVIDSYFEDLDEAAMKRGGVKNIPVGYLALSIAALAEVDALYCVKGWHNYRGCKIEHDVAEAYGIEIITDSDDEYQK